MSLWKKKDKSKDKESSKSEAKPPKPKKSKVNTIWAACEQGDVEVFDKMIKKKNGISLVNSPNEEGRYPIHIASGSGQVALVQRLLECGAQCNMIENTEDRWNVLQWAVKSHNFQMMKLIASQPSLKPDFRGPSSGTSHMDRNSALHIFAKTFEEDPEDIISLIVQRGANINIVNSHGETPLHVACTYKRVVIARALVSHGANVNAQNDHGETPLHLGARYGPEAMVKVLLQGGGNPDIAGAHGTPLEVATSVAIRKLLSPAAPAPSQSQTTPSASSAPVPSPEVVTEVSSPSPIARMLSKKYFWLVEYSEISMGTKIGEGGFGSVYRGSWRGIDVAVKFLKNNAQVNEDLLGVFLHEVSLMARLRHQNILLFVGACLTPPKICFLTEFISHGNLRHLLDKECIAPLKKVNMAIEATRGLTYLHSQNPPVLHRDLKTSNVLVDDNYHIKLADFGLSHPQAHPTSNSPQTQQDGSKNNTQTTTSKTYSTSPDSASTSQFSSSAPSGESTPTAEEAPQDQPTSPSGKEDSASKETNKRKSKSGATSDLPPASSTSPATNPPGTMSVTPSSNSGFLSIIEQGGTLYTMAPEVLNGFEYTQESDIYALGVIFWELSSEKIPYEGLTEIQMVRAIVEDHLPPVTELGAAFTQLVQDMLQKNPSDRPKLTEIAERLKVVRSQLGEGR